jgi:RNA polymerase sigma factor (sigma-70 family)
VTPPTGYTVAEIQLAGKAREGDNAALEALYRRYRGPLYAHALRMLRDPEEAADLVQEAFARALSSIESTGPVLKFRAWIYRILTNLCLRVVTRGSIRQAWFCYIRGSRR